MRRWLVLVRFRQWAHFLVLPLAGLAGAPARSMALDGLRGAVIAGGVLSFGYLLNGICDRHGDLDSVKNPVRQSTVDVRTLIRVDVAVGVATLLFAAWHSRIALLSALVSMLSGTVYSAGFRLKALPFVGTLLNVLCFAPLLAVGLTEPASPSFGTMVVVFTALLLQNQLLHEAADADEDRHAGSRTTFLALGPSFTAVLAVGLGAIVPLALHSRHGRGTTVLTLVAAAIFAVTIPLLVARAGMHAATMAKLRWAHRWASVITGAALFLAIRLEGYG